MHFRASSSNGAVMAFVGQAAMQRVHLPQWFRSGASGSSSSVVRISARKIQLPSLRLMMFHLGWMNSYAAIITGR